MRKTILLGLLLPTVLALAGTSLSRAQAAAPHYKVAKRIALGGDGFWDYLTVDSRSHRLYVSHSTRVQVVDIDRDSVVGEIAGTPGVHGIALAPDLGRGYTSNGRDSSVTVFDLGTLATIARIRVRGRNPDAIVYDPVTRRVFTMNGGSGTTTAIDAVAGTVIDTLALGGRPEFAVADGRGRIYVNLEDRSAIVAFDSRSLAILGRWPLAPGEEPSGLAIDRAHRRLFAVCANERLVVVEADSGRVVTALPIGGGVDGVAFDPESGLAFSSNGAGTLTVVHEDDPGTFRVVETVTTQRGARTLALDERTHRIYLATADFGPPPAPTPERPHPRPSIVPGSFVILVLEPAPADSRGEAPGSQGTHGEASASGDFQESFTVDKADLASAGRNPYFVLEPGYRLTLVGRAGEKLLITVLDQTEKVDGVQTRVVEERESARGKLVEVSRNFIAISKKTNDVFNFGEDVDVYKGGKVVEHEGAWRAGAGGARVGLMLPGRAEIGAKFYQEQAPRVAMDRTEIRSTSATLRTPAGEFEGCLEVEETTPLEPGNKEHKLYAPGVGLVQYGSLFLARPAEASGGVR